MRRILPLLALAASCSKTEEPAASWTPGTMYPTAREANARGYFDRRGLIHAHSVYSHDACDNMPEVGGVRDESCLDDFRRGLCQSKHDFVMLTDHADALSRTPYADLLLYRPDRGDRLIEHAPGQATANIAACPDGFSGLILPGSESGVMPVGLESHVSEDQAERDAIYDQSTPEAIELLKAHGAVALVAHTEDWTVDQLIALPLDGFEMYNLHANTLLSAGNALELLVKLDQKDPGLPEPNLVLINLFSEDPRYLSTWGSVLARGAKKVTTMGTDCHRNTFPQIAQDGERLDSYRRMMSWFSNHLLVRAAETPIAGGPEYTDRELKDALRAGRLYGAFEVLGHPRGFDFFAEVGGAIEEMGAELSLSDRPVLQVRMPKLEALDPKAEAPVMRLRILRAIEGGWEEVLSSAEASASVVIDRAGAYRAEIRMEPRHLTGWLGDSKLLARREMPWIYSNAIYVR